MTADRKLVAYGRLGRAMTFAGKLNGESGDHEPGFLLRALLSANPDWDIVLISICKDTPAELESAGIDPARVINPWTVPGISKRPTGGGASEGGQGNIDRAEWAWAQVGRYASIVDGVIVWMGQHGSTSQPIPLAGSTYGDDPPITIPIDQTVTYGAHIARFVNVFGDRSNGAIEPVWLCSDVRNFMKLRDIKWPYRQTVVTQCNWSRKTKAYRWEDKRDPDHVDFLGVYANGTPHKPTGYPHATSPYSQAAALRDTSCPLAVYWDEPNDQKRTWTYTQEYRYSSLELAYVDKDTPYDEELEGRVPFGLLSTESETRVVDGTSRIEALGEYVFPLPEHLKCAFIAGTWSPQSTSLIRARLGITPRVVPHAKINAVHQSTAFTMCLPVSGSMWTSPKWWEASAAGTVAFMHPFYDKQNNILRDAPYDLRSLVRVSCYNDLLTRMEYLLDRPDEWLYFVRLAREHFLRRSSQNEAVREISDRVDFYSRRLPKTNTTLI